VITGGRNEGHELSIRPREFGWSGSMSTARRSIRDLVSRGKVLLAGGADTRGKYDRLDGGLRPAGGRFTAGRTDLRAGAPTQRLLRLMGESIVGGED